MKLTNIYAAINQASQNEATHHREHGGQGMSDDHCDLYWKGRREALADVLMGAFDDDG